MLKIINPYPGFESGFYRPYIEGDSSLFFGRDKDISIIKLKLRQKKLVSLISEPKMGKTSLLRAGIIPNLRENPFDGHNGSEWKCLYMMPDENPIHSLAKAIVNPLNKVSDKMKPSMEEEVYDQLQKNDYGLVRVAESIIGDRNINILLVIDDFIDVFQNEVDDRVRTKFLRLIHKTFLEKSIPIFLIISFNKDDFKDNRMRQNPKLYKALSMGMHKIKFLDHEGLKQAIDQPSKLTNSNIDEGLSNEMMLMLLEDGDQLRKLQLLMSRTWLEWKRNHKDKTITKAHYFRATGQKSKAVAKGLMKGGKISAGHLESLAKQSADADGVEMAKTDYEKLNLENQNLFKRIIPHLIDDSSRDLKARSIERKKAVDLLGISMEELGNLVTQIPTILAMDRKKLSINDITIFENWDELKEWIRNNNILKLKFIQIADAAILHYIDGIDIKSVISRQQYKDLFKYIDVDLITVSWARAQHQQYELGLDFIRKLQETYGVIAVQTRKIIKKKMTFGKPSESTKVEENIPLNFSDSDDDQAKIEALKIMGLIPNKSNKNEPQIETLKNKEKTIAEDSKTPLSSNNQTPLDDEDEAIRKLLNTSDNSEKERQNSKEESEIAKPKDLLSNPKTTIAESKTISKPKKRIVLKSKDKLAKKPSIKLKPKIVIKKK